MMGPGGLRLILSAALIVHEASGRLGTNASWTTGRKSMPSRSLEELADGVFQELLFLHEDGVAGSFQIPKVISNVHKLIVEESANDDDEFGLSAQRRALMAIQSGAAKLEAHMDDQVAMILDDAEAKGFESWELNDTNGMSASVNGRRHLLSDKQKLYAGSVAKLTVLITFFTVFIVQNILDAESNSKPWPYLASDDAFFKGALGESFQQIYPCSKLPLSSDNYFSYLPVSQGLTGTLTGKLSKFDQGGAALEYMKVCKLCSKFEFESDVLELTYMICPNFLGFLTIPVLV